MKLTAFLVTIGLFLTSQSALAAVVTCTLSFSQSGGRLGNVWTTYVGRDETPSADQSGKLNVNVARNKAIEACRSTRGPISSFKDDCDPSNKNRNPNTSAHMSCEELTGPGPVTCSIELKDTFLRFFYTRKKYSYTDPNPGKGLSEGTPNIAKAQAQVLANCNAGEKSQTSECSTKNTSPAAVFECSNDHGQIQFDCTAKPEDAESGIRGQGASETEGQAIAVSNCEKWETHSGCQAQSCSEAVVEKTAWSNTAPSLGEASVTARDAKLLPADLPATTKSGVTAGNAGE